MAKSKTELVVDPEFAALMPPQTDEELERLHASLKADGCLDKLKAHKETGILLDGHTRKKFCDKNGIEYGVEWVSVKGATPDGDREAALGWMIEYQLGRRNLTELQKSVLRGKDYLRSKKAVGRPVKADDEYRLTDGDADEEDDSAKPSANGDTASVLAAKYNTSTSTILRDAELATAVGNMPAKERAAFLTGKSEMGKGDVIAKYAPPKKRAVAKAKKPGAAKFPWAEWTKTYERLVRATDEIAKAHDSKNANEHRSALKLLADYDEKVQEWRKRLEAKQAGKE